MATVCAGSSCNWWMQDMYQQSVAGSQWDCVKKGIAFAILSHILVNAGSSSGIWIFKSCPVTGDGITAFQMDIKNPGISLEIMEKALQAGTWRKASHTWIMDQSLVKPRETASDLAPRILNCPLKVNQDQIGCNWIRWKTIRKCRRLFGVAINIEEDGTVNIASPNKENAVSVRSISKKWLLLPDDSRAYEGVITNWWIFGAFVEIIPEWKGSFIFPNR